MTEEAQAAGHEPGEPSRLRRSWSKARKVAGAHRRRLNLKRAVLSDRHGKHWGWARRGLQAGELYLNVKGHHEAAYGVRSLVWLGDALFRPSNF